MPDQPLVERQQPKPPCLVLRVRCLETPGNHIQLALRLGDRAARSKPSDHSQEVESADQRLLRVEWERQEQVQRTGSMDEWIEGKPK